MIDLVAISAFTHNGQSLSNGDPFTARPIEAAALTFQNKAVFASKYQADDLPTPAPRTKRKYRRRDMAAETA